jgi:hypothetical protein
MVRDFSGSLDDKKSARGVLMTGRPGFRPRHPQADRVGRRRTSGAVNDRARRGVKRGSSGAKKKLDERYFRNGRLLSRES